MSKAQSTPAFRQAFGQRLRACRKAQDLPLHAVTTLTGISIGHLSDVERGQRLLGIQHAATLAQALHCSLDMLCGIEKPRIQRYPIMTEVPDDPPA